MRLRKYCCLLSLAVTVSLFTACASEDQSRPVEQETVVYETVVQASETIFGKVTSVQKDSITINVISNMLRPESSVSAPGLEGELPNKPEDEPLDAPDMDTPKAPDENMVEELEQAGQEKTYTITEKTVYTINGATAALSELKTGDMVTAVIKGDEVESIVAEDPMDAQGMKAAPNAPDQGERSFIETEGAYQVEDAQNWDGETYDTQDADMSTIMVSQGGTLNISKAKLTKSGNATEVENSNFFGTNAAFLVKEGSTASVTDSSITTDAEGANAIFATGENARIDLSNVKIHTKGNSSRGLDATYGGSISADTIEIDTQGAHCAAVATDRGEGSIHVTNGTLNTAGEGSPCIYSTGSIEVEQSRGLALGSSIAVVEGKNSITVKESQLTGYGLGRAQGGIDDTGIMIYQSMSGDAGEGCGSFQAEDSTLSIAEESPKYTSAPMFFVTNTDAIIRLNNTDLQFGSGVLLHASGNTGEWGKSGDNGGNVQLFAVDQSLAGDVIADGISNVEMDLANSEWKGIMDDSHKAAFTLLSLDENSIWDVQGDSYVTVLRNAEESCSNIHSNGYTIYYDSTNLENTWLNGQEITLSGGGKLAPMK